MKYIINRILKFFSLIIIFRNGDALGEQLYMTSLVDKLKNNKIILLTTCDDLFKNNPHIFLLINIKNKSFIINILINILYYYQGSNIICFYPFKLENLHNQNYLKNYSRFKHVIEINSERSKIQFKKHELKNFFYFSDKENIEFKNRYNYLKKFVLVQSETKKTFTNNKNWDVNKIQEIIDFFPKKNWVQIGSENDYKLNNTIDLRGKTSIRELAYLIKNSNYIICLEGFFAHLSSCFSTKAFVIYSGIVPIENMIYKNIIPIKINYHLKCSPCYKINDCDLEKKYCTDDIKSADVIKKILIYET